VGGGGGGGHWTEKCFHIVLILQRGETRFCGISGRIGLENA